jgi:hypothetical protein
MLMPAASAAETCCRSFAFLDALSTSLLLPPSLPPPLLLPLLVLPLLHTSSLPLLLLLPSRPAAAVSWLLPVRRSPGLPPPTAPFALV